MSKWLAESDREPGVDRLLSLLNPVLQHHWQTQLVPGSGEPVYLPASDASALHQIIFAHGYFSSALHELAHWSLAGESRRQLEDYGYWYCPDGRNARQQAEFELVEVKPQALEWWYSLASGRHFRVSRDNLSGQATDGLAFRQAVYQQARFWAVIGLPERALQILVHLSQSFRQPLPALESFLALPDE